MEPIALSSSQSISSPTEFASFRSWNFNIYSLIYEIQVNWVEKEDEDPPGNIFDRLAELAQHTPPAVISLVDYLRRNPPQERPGELYTYSFPFVEWRCSLPSP